jgi:asparagine synthase (glutamine-hydrolysing)
MSAIWGLWQHGASPDTSSGLARMTAALHIFGPTACWQAPHIALGRAIANTLPEDAGDAQPLHLPNGDTLVASVRLDDRHSLTAQLGCPLHLPDSELLAAAWLRWGADTPSHLTGDFAFAVWQPRRQQLFCARDHLGIRSLYYTATPALFAFATLPRALPVPRALNPDSLAASLAYFPEPPQGTVFRDVLRLPSGHSLTASPDGVRLTRYWRPEEAPAVRLPNDEAYAEAFRDALDTAVADRLRSSGPVGAMLSGGFDSGAVTSSAAMILAARGLPLPAFTGVPDPSFDGPVPPDRFGDESRHAAAVAALYPNIHHSFVTPLAQFPLDLTAEHFARVDAPGGSLAIAPSAAAMAAAHRTAGVRVILNGVLGNLTISYNGLPLIPQLARQGQWLRWFRESRALTRRAHFRWPGVCALSFGPQAPPFLWRWVQRRRSGVGSGLSRYALLHPRYFAARRLHELAEERGFDPLCRPPADGRRFRIQLLTQRSNAIHNAAAEYRDPTGDRRVIEFCLGVPEEQFLRNGTTKFLIRNALRDRLPPIVRNEWRKGLCGADWHLRVAPYRDRFRDALDDIARSLLAGEILDLPRLRTLLDRWPSQWSSPAIHTEYGMGFCHAIHTGAFIRWVERETS